MQHREWRTSKNLLSFWRGRRAGIGDLILPKENRNDFEELSVHIREGRRFYNAKYFNDVWWAAYYPHRTQRSENRGSFRKEGSDNEARKAFSADLSADPIRKGAILSLRLGCSCPPVAK